MLKLTNSLNKVGKMEQLEEGIYTKNLLSFEGLPMSRGTLCCLLQGYALRKDLGPGRRLHSFLVGSGFSFLGPLAEHLIRFFALCGSLLEANLVFSSITKPSVLAWHGVISAHVSLGERWRAVELLHIMQQEGLKPNKSSFLCILKEFGNMRALEHGRLSHSEIVKNGLELDVMVGSTLVDVYAKCGSLVEARKLFDKLPNRNVVSGNSMISGYARHGLGHFALDVFSTMQQEELFPDEVTFASVLRACSCVEAILQGMQIHDQIIRRGLESNLSVGSTLVDMYAKCGSLDEAHETFHELPNRDVVSWCTLISGYVQDGSNLTAFDLFMKMQQEGIKPDKIAFSSILKACASVRILDKGRLLHEQIIKSSLESDMVIGSALIDMYAQCKSLAEAQNLFDGFHNRNVILWGAIVAGYVELGECFSALILFEKMQQEGIKPNNAIFSCILKACGSIGAVVKGMLIHNHLIKDGLEGDVAIGNSLIDMYVKCGTVEGGRRVFDGLPNRNVVSWGAMIAGYTQQGSGHPALELFERMQQQGVIPDKVIFLCVIKACGSTGAVEQARLIHRQILRSGLARDMAIGNTLVDMYAKCGSLEEAHKVFNELPDQDVVSWSSLIAGYVQHGHGLTALELFDKMQQKGISADRVAYLAILKACSSVGALGYGMLIHVAITKSGLGSDIVVGNTLIDMYTKCGSLEDASKLFYQLQNRDNVSYCAMIAGCAQHPNGHNAVVLFNRMQNEGFKPNKVFFSCILKTCGNLESVEKGKFIHNEIIRNGFKADGIVGITLVDMYAKCGSLEAARKVFDKLQNQSVVSWGAMIYAYAQYGQGIAALLLFKEMQQEGIKPNGVIFCSILKACSSVGAIGQGRLIHSQIIGTELELDAFVGASIVDMYAKCGSLEEAHNVLNKLPIQDIVSWGAMIAGYAQCGNFRLAGQCIEDMQQQGLRLDASIYSGILAACSHTGHVDEGNKYFTSMTGDHSVIPITAHFNCMVDLLGRAGCLDEAEELVKCMPVRPDITGLTSLLAACRSYGKIELAGQWFEQAVCLNPNIAAGYVLMLNIYANVCLWKDVYKVQELKKCAGVLKKPGMALIEINNKLFEFMVGDKIHSQSDEIHAKLMVLSEPLKDEGYVPQLDLGLKLLQNHGKEGYLEG